VKEAYCRRGDGLVWLLCFSRSL